MKEEDRLSTSNKMGIVQQNNDDAKLLMYLTNLMNKPLNFVETGQKKEQLTGIP